MAGRLLGAVAKLDKGSRAEENRMVALIHRKWSWTISISIPKYIFVATILITSLLFQQQYYWEDSLHEEIHFKWKLQTQVSICGRISQKRKKNKQRKYISENDWKIVLANWSTDEAKAKSQSAADSRTSAPVGLKMHVHGAGPRCFVNIGYRMVSFPTCLTCIFPFI